MLRIYCEEPYRAMSRTVNDPKLLYLDLLKKSLTRYLAGEIYRPFSRRALRWLLEVGPVGKLLQSRGIAVMRRCPFDAKAREEGRDWPSEAETMIGLQRLDNLQECIVTVVDDGVPGDLIETGVWRGGASIFMRAVLKVYGDTSRLVWLADSFRGLPKPNAKAYPADSGDCHWQYGELAVSLDTVKSHFQRYGLLDDQVRFLIGWFSETLPDAPMERLALIRLDGDMYESTMDGLSALYPKLSVGGYLIVDDYGAIPACRQAVHDYREQHGINEPIETIDWTGIFWRRAGA